MRPRDRTHSKDVILYGIHPVTETIRAGKRKVRTIFLARESSASTELKDMMGVLGCHVSVLGDQELTRICGSPHHQGVAAEVDPYPYCVFEHVLDGTADTASCIILLDHLQDPFNLGSIIRSAECLGAAGIVLTKDNSCAVTAAVEKTSAGATAYLPISRVVNMVRAIREIKNAGFWVYGMDSTAPHSLYSSKLAHKVAFVMGGEGTGLRRLVREQCDITLSIPMCGQISSLNVSHTAAIALSEFEKSVSRTRRHSSAKEL